MRNSVFLLALIVLVSCSQKKVDDWTLQPPITTYSQIDTIYNSFEKVKYSDLPAEYIKYTSLDGKYAQTHAQKEFLVVRNNDLNRFLVGNSRVSDFLAGDKYFSQDAEENPNRIQFLLINKNLLYRICDLSAELKKQGYNEYGFLVRDGYRHPTWNRMRGGAENSQHIYGNAVDILIYDINNDGIVDDTDKQIVLEILDKKIIKNTGGIGRYPGTNTIHIDVRGFRARWDFQ